MLQSFIHNIQHSLSPGLRILTEAQYQQTLGPPHLHAVNPSSSSSHTPQEAAPQSRTRQGLPAEGQTGIPIS